MQKKENIKKKIKELRWMEDRIGAGKMATTDDRDIALTKIKMAVIALRWAMLPNKEHIPLDDHVVMFAGKNPKSFAGQSLVMGYEEAFFVQHYLEENTDISKDVLDWILLDPPIIPEKIAVLVADQLDALMASEHAAGAEEKFLEEIRVFRYRKCLACAGQASLIPKLDCKFCHGAGAIDIFGGKHALSVDGIRRFSEFCRDSGGYMIVHRKKQTEV